MPATLRKGRKPAKAHQSGRKTPRLAATAPAPLAPPKAARSVLVATDGSQPAVAAIRLARALADRGDWSPHVLTVCEPLPVSVAGVALPTPASEHEVALTNSMLERLQRQLRRYGASSWNLAIEYGRAAPLIVRAAKENRGELIVLGLSHHHALGRFFGAETAARVVRHTDIPVLAVHPSTKGLPHVAVVAMDFGDSSIRAAREAYALVEPPGRLHLVHVRWGYNITSLRNTEWDRAYTYGVEHGFARVRAELAERPGVTVTTELRDGGVVRTLLETAKRMHADLVAFGSHSQTVLDRLVIGSTTSEVLRESECSVLVAPPMDDRA